MAQNRKRTPKTDEQVTNELFGAIRRNTLTLEQRGANEDPWMAADMLGLAADLEAAAVRLIAGYRQRGYRWEDIGIAMGISGVTACKRYKAKTDAINAAQER